MLKFSTIHYALNRVMSSDRCNAFKARHISVLVLAVQGYRPFAQCRVGRIVIRCFSEVVILAGEEYIGRSK